MDISERLQTELVLLPQTVTSTGTGVGFDRTNFEGAILSCFMGSAVGSPAGVYTVTFQVKDSEDDSTYENVTSGLSSGVAVITNSQTKLDIALDLLPCKKYVKVDATAVFTGGSSPYVSVAALGVFGYAKKKPTE